MERMRTDNCSHSVNHQKGLNFVAWTQCIQLNTLNSDPLTLELSKKIDLIYINKIILRCPTCFTLNLQGYTYSSSDVWIFDPDKMQFLMAVPSQYVGTFVYIAIPDCLKVHGMKSELGFELTVDAVQLTHELFGIVASRLFSVWGGRCIWQVGRGSGCARCRRGSSTGPGHYLRSDGKSRIELAEKQRYRKQLVQYVEHYTETMTK